MSEDGRASIVLVTRPEPGLSETTGAVAALGFLPVAAPMARIRALSPVMPERVQAVLLTSGQAVGPVAMLAPWLRDRTVLAVGDRTAQQARAAGFGDVTSADGDAPLLAALAVGRLSPGDGAVLLACGRGQGRGLASMLREAGFAVIRRSVYRAVPTTRLDPLVVAALADRRVAAILLFSAETAETLVRVLPGEIAGALSDVRALVLSAAVAARVSRLPWKRIETAVRPTSKSLLALLSEDTEPPPIP